MLYERTYNDPSDNNQDNTTGYNDSFFREYKAFILRHYCSYFSMASKGYQTRYWLLKAKFKLLAYALASLSAEKLILKTMLSPAAKLHVDGSAVLVAIAFCQVDWTPVEADTAEPQAVKPLPVLR